MKTRLMSVMALTVGVACATATADTLRVTGGPFQAPPGGEFTITPITGYAGNFSGSSFQSFCLERNQPIAIAPGTSGNANLYDFQMNTVAVSGGFGGGNPDPLSAQVAYLYTQFREGDLSNYAFGGTAEQRLASAGALQEAIWFIEQEYPVGTTVSAQANAWIAEANAAVANVAIWGDTLGLVRVLNLSQNGNEAQDMLTLIPLPPAAWAGLASLAGLGLYVRRRKQSMA